MKKVKKKVQIATSIFVVMSIASLVMLGLGFSFLRIKIFKNRNDFKNNYINNSDFDTSDNYITKSKYFNKTLLEGPRNSMVDPSIGDDDSSVVITMYSDVKCDYCYEQEKKIKEVLDLYNGKVKFILKDYPEHKLDSISWKSALAARCAQAQNSYWEYHDLLFVNKESLNDNKFIELAELLNMDIKDFNRCINNEETIGLIINNIVEARELKIKGIPLIYINNEEVSSEISSEELKNKIDFEIKIKDII